MHSKVTSNFWKLFNDLPENVQNLAIKNYDIWRENPLHPSLHFKNIKNNLFSIRIGLFYRALGYFDKETNTITWTWIGTQGTYDKKI